MCGIAGLITRDSLVEKNELQAMLKRLQHRGSDSIGYCVHDKVGLAHARLSIIDLEGGDQPIVSLDGNLTLVANGEIYNYIELTRDLTKKGCYFTTESDSESIMHSYQLYGEEFVHRLNGMFAFALYDKQSGKIFLGRDRMGIKPLFYTISSKRIAFASEIKALIPILSHSPEINPLALSQFFHNQFTSGRETIIKGIYHVLPGEMIIINRELEISHRQYWTPLSTQPRDFTFEEAQEEFEALFEQVIREHIRPDVPYGLFLSGGIDSAIVLTMLHRFQKRAIRSFSVGYKDARIRDELEPAKSIAHQFNTDHEPITLDKEKLIARIPYVIWMTDDLMCDYACLPTSFLAERASEQLKVVFTGEGGDEVFAGYGKYRKSTLQGWLNSLIAPGSGGFRTRSQMRNSWAKVISGPMLKEYHNEFRQPFIRAWQSCPKRWSRVTKSQYVDVVTALPDNLLIKVDRMLMSFGVEGRVPYLDHRIVNFGLSLPDNLKVKTHYGKLFLRRWAKKYLPEDHLWRKKNGFYVPVGECLSEGFLNVLREKLLRNNGIQTWFDVEGIRDLFSYHAKGGKSFRGIWCLMQFAIWHRIFIENIGIWPTPEENPLDWISAC